MSYYDLDYCLWTNWVWYQVSLYVLLSNIMWCMDIVIVKCDFNDRYNNNSTCIAFSIPGTCYQHWGVEPWFTSCVWYRLWCLVWFDKSSMIICFNTAPKPRLYSSYVSSWLLLQLSLGHWFVRVFCQSSLYMKYFIRIGLLHLVFNFSFVVLSLIFILQVSCTG